MLSPSRLSLFKECPHCFWLDINKGIKRPPTVFPSLPGGVDSVLKKHYDKFRAKGELPPEIKTLKGHLFADMGKMKVWRNCFKGLEYIDKKSSIGLRGALDDLFVDERGFHIPLDYKTRGWPVKEDTHEHYQHQLDIYCFLLEENGMKTADQGILVFYHPTSVDRDGKFNFRAEIVKVKTSKKNGEKLFLDAVKVLQGDEPEEMCPFCAMMTAFDDLRI